MLWNSFETLVTLFIWPKSAPSRFPLCKKPEVGLVLKAMEVTSPSPATLIGASGMAFGFGFVTTDLWHMKSCTTWGRWLKSSVFYFSRVVLCFFGGSLDFSYQQKHFPMGKFWCFLPRFCFRDRDCNASYVFDGCWEQLPVVPYHWVESGITTWKLTCPLKRDHFNGNFIFQPSIFRGDVSIQGGIHGDRIIEILRAYPLNTSHFILSGSVHFGRDAYFFEWVFPKIGVPQNGWFIVEILIKLDDLGVPPFSEHPNDGLVTVHDLFSDASSPSIGCWTEVANL